MQQMQCLDTIAPVSGHDGAGVRAVAGFAWRFLQQSPIAMTAASVPDPQRPFAVVREMTLIIVVTLALVTAF